MNKNSKTAMEFTLNYEKEKDKILNRYKNLQDQMIRAHSALMKSMGLEHNDSGIYRPNTIEYFVNEAVQYFILNKHLDIDVHKKGLENLPNEIKLALPKNRGYVDVFIDGVLVEEKRDLR